MNVSFQLGEVVNGFEITGRNGLTRYTAENENVRIYFETDAGEGINYSKILAYYDKRSYRGYRAMRYLRKYVSLVQGFSNALFERYQAENESYSLNG
jgi:hypothetical protein